MRGEAEAVGELLFAVVGVEAAEDDPFAVGEAFAVDVADRLQSLTTTYDAAVELIKGRASQPGGEIGRSSGA